MDEVRKLCVGKVAEEPRGMSVFCKPKGRSPGNLGLCVASPIGENVGNKSINLLAIVNMLYCAKSPFVQSDLTHLTPCGAFAA